MSTWKDRARQDWRYEFRYQKKRHSGRGFRNRKEALAAEAAHRRDLRSGKRTLVPMGFREIASLYLDDSKRRHATKTYKGKVRAFKDFLDFHGDIRIDEITPYHIDIFLKTRPSNNNYNVYRKELSSLFNWIRRKMRIGIENPCQPLDKLPHTEKQRVMPTEQEILKLIMVANSDERALLLCVLHTAARIGEILRMKWSDVDFEKEQVCLWTRKRRGGAYEADYIYMSQDLYQVMYRFYGRRTQDEWVFYNEKTGDRYYHRPKFMKGLCKRAGISPYFGFHALRHFMASLLATDKKVSTKTISTFLRHKSMRTTEIYISSFDEAQKSALDRLKGRFPEPAKPKGEVIPIIIDGTDGRKP